MAEIKKLEKKNQRVYVKMSFIDGVELGCAIAVGMSLLYIFILMAFVALIAGLGPMVAEMMRAIVP